MRGLTLHRGSCWRGRTLRLLTTTTTPPPRRWSSTNGGVGVLTGLTPKWQPLWEQREPVRGFPEWDAAEGQPKKMTPAYILPMFPYPSGTLHLGHLRVYTISDVLARAKLMLGYDVLHPIAWDAFGLPAENAAIERGVHPADWTARNIADMKEQMMQMGGRWDWDKEFRTCDPDYYKQTQRLFLLLHERQLAYQAESYVNWDPVDQTVLANEQVDVKGCSWRSGAKVEKKRLKQWFLKITHFQKPLLEDLESLAIGAKWPPNVLAMQRNWIGRSMGTQLRFDMKSQDPTAHFDPVDVFTTRADTLLGVQYIALSLRHPIVQTLSEKDASLRDFLKLVESSPTPSKQGYLLPDVQAHNPLANLVQDEHVARPIPVFVAPYVLDDYGSGAVMGVPAHDPRDHDFWKKNRRSEPVHHVIVTKTSMEKGSGHIAPNDKPVIQKGYVKSSDPNFAGLSSKQAIEKVIEQINQAGGSAKRTENWRLRDWLISRQRYWGTPIPIIHCDTCGAVPVPVEDLPVKLPNLPASYFQGRTGNPLAEDEHWKKTTCPKCHGPAERETDTMDTFMDSSWYYFRFLDTQAQNQLVKPLNADGGMPVDVYIGGVEHSILHLLYARFISKFLTSISTWPLGNEPENLGEPFKRLITQGMVHGKTYSDPATGRFLRPEEVDLGDPSSPFIKDTLTAPKISYEKMSKSKYNGVDPGTTIATYGADATRAHMLFQAPIRDVLEWDAEKITGVQRWLKRVLRLSTAFWYPVQELAKFRPMVDIDQDVAFLLESFVQNGTIKPTGGPAPEIDYSRGQFLAEKAISSQLALYLNLIKVEERALLSKTFETIASVKQSYTETYALNTVISDLMTLTNTIWDTPHVASTTPVFKYLAVLHLLRLLAPIAPGVAEEGWHALISRANHKVRPSADHPYSRIRDDAGPSIFTFGFPKNNAALVRLCNQTITCVVQFDGKKKFNATIPRPVHLLGVSSGPDEPLGVSSGPDEPLAETQRAQLPNLRHDELVAYLLGEILKTKLGQKYMGRHLQGDGKPTALWQAAGTLQTHPKYNLIPKDWTIVVAGFGGVVNLVSPKTDEETEVDKRMNLADRNFLESGGEKKWEMRKGKSEVSRRSYEDSRRDDDTQGKAHGGPVRRWRW